ncbi:MAG: hypothetical protein IJL19_06540 [Clostridiales bacterium]|nr:hypothetical protein [Clostridiales bacterium]
MRARDALKRPAIILLIFAAVFALCSCSVAGKSDLIRYAKNNYGNCEYIRQEHSGSGNDEVRTVYLKDKETGIEYSVSSYLYSVNFDGSSLGHAEQKSSDFPSKYIDYLFDKAGDEIDDLAARYGFKFYPEYDVYTLHFDDRDSGAHAEEAIVEFDKIIAGYDTKDLRVKEYLLYIDDSVYLGSYNASSKVFTKSNTLNVIDFVHENYDPDAEYLGSMGAYISQYLSYEEIDELFPSDIEETPRGSEYYFKGSDDEIFIAIDLEEFGAKTGGIRLFRDYAYGMEEIEY